MSCSKFRWRPKDKGCFMDRKARILVVDDERSLRVLLQRELTREGYRVDAVVNGEDALKKLKEESYHLVLLDIVMPVKDGIQVLREIDRL